MTANNIIDKYLGVPYVDNGRDPSIGLDCWGLLICILKDLFDVEFPDLHYKKFSTLKKYVKSGKSQQPVFTIENKDILNEYDMSKWVYSVSDKKCGDIILICPIENLAIHAGIYLQGDKFIHCTSGDGVVVSDLIHLDNKIEVFYRLNPDKITGS